MEQINENLVVLSAPEPFDPEQMKDFLSIYLIGTVSGSEGVTWQQKFINGLAKVLNPGDPNYNKDITGLKFCIINGHYIPTPGPITLENAEFVEKTQWNLGILKNVDSVFCNFLRRSKSKAALDGFLMAAMTGKLVTRCPQDYIGFPKISVITRTLELPLLGETDTVNEVLETLFQTIPKFKEQLELSLREGPKNTGENNEKADNTK